MINKEVTISVQLADIKYIISLEHEEMGCGYSKLTKGTDYEVYKDITSLFIKVTKEYDCGKEHHLKLTVNRSVDGTDVQWIIHFQPNGKNLQLQKKFFFVKEEDKSYVQVFLVLVLATSAIFFHSFFIGLFQLNSKFVNTLVWTSSG